MKPIARLLLAAFAATVAAGCTRKTAVHDPVAIADQVMASLGGAKKWDDLRGVRWSFGAEIGDTVKSLRRHCWDKQTGWHRVEGTMRDGTKFLFIHNLRDSTGKAWMNGQAIAGDSLKKLLKRARSLWTNDTYWMLMPYKLRDPGVTVAYDGEMTDPTGTWEKLALSFDHVGETPGDHYWVYVNRDNHRIGRWDMVLEGDQPPPVSYSWDDWQERDGLWFATAHRQGDRNIFTRDIETVQEFRPGEFDGP